MASQAEHTTCRCQVAVRSCWLYYECEHDADDDEQGIAGGAAEPNDPLEDQEPLLAELVPEGLAPSHCLSICWQKPI